MASRSVSRAHSSEAIACTHALVEFIDEGCTGVVPVQRVFGETFQAGTPVTVLWSNRKEYAAVFLYSGSKKQCQKEEDRILDDEAGVQTTDCDEVDNYESGDNVDEGKEEQDNESPDEGKENQERSDNAENGTPKRKRRRRLLKNKDGGQSNNKKRKKGGDKENKKKRGKGHKKKTEIEEDFIVRIGKAPMRTLSFNVSDTPHHDLQNKEDTLRKEIEPYCGQTIELYSSDEENDEFYRCCAMIEEGFTITNKHIRIPVEPVEGDQRRSNDPPYHYTGGAKEIDFENKVNELKMMLQNNEQKRDTVCNEIREDVTKLADKLEETQKTLAVILAKLIRPNAVRDDGFAPPPTTPVTTTSTILALTLASTPVTISTTRALTTTVTASTTRASTTTVTASTTSRASTTTVTASTTSRASTTTVTASTTSRASTTTVTASTTRASTATVTASTTSTALTTTVTASTTQASTPPASTPVTASTTPTSTPVTGSFVALPADLTSPIHFEEVQSSGSAASGGILDDSDVQRIKRKSCSRKNFSSRLVRELFDDDTRRKSNVAGKLGKLKLNPVLMDYVKSLSFQYYPLEQHEKEKDGWSKCVIAIDECNRRKPKEQAMQ